MGKSVLLMTNERLFFFLSLDGGLRVYTETFLKCT